MVNALTAPNDNLIIAHKATINDIILFSGNLKTVLKFKIFTKKEIKLSFDKKTPSSLLYAVFIVMNMV